LPPPAREENPVFRSPLPSLPDAPAVAPSLWEGHLARLLEVLRIQASAAEAPKRRHGRQANARQCLQQDIRKEAVACYHWLHNQDLTLAECSQLLRLAARTLRAWDYACRSEAIRLLPVGRPPTRSALPVRQAILDYLKLTGPGIGVPTLQEQFRGVARSELADLLRRYRAVCRVRFVAYRRVLHWQTPGRIWAADFTEPSCSGRAGSLPPIAGHHPYLLAVRDLASGLTLAWEPLSDLTEEVTQAALRRLFTLHGAPLVLKVDNGSAFRAQPFQEFLQASGVLPLYSPPSCPGYNGSIEAAIGSLKRRTEEHARAEGRAGRWEFADLRAAQAAANVSHPRRLNGRTSISVWESRPVLDRLERVVFELTVARERMQARDEVGIPQDEMLDHWRGSAVDRRAIERALVEHGHLLFTRRRIPLTIRPGKVAADV
jgi:transposase InsO family protein